jgi:hypothetical protein
MNFRIGCDLEIIFYINENFINRNLIMSFKLNLLFSLYKLKLHLEKNKILLLKFQI